MVIEPELPTLGKARIWIGELPPVRYAAEQVSSKCIQTNRPAPTHTRLAAVELLRPIGPISLYGLLGATHHPIASPDPELAIFVHASAPTGPAFSETLARSPYEDVRVGLPNEYVRGVVDGVSEAHHRDGGLAPGRLVFDCAAHGMVGSSPVFFQRLSRIVCRLLCAEEGQLSQGELLRCLEIPE